MKEIKIIIDESGNFEVDVVGYRGRECKEATKFLENYGKVLECECKPEMYQNKSNTIKQKQ